MTDLKLVQNEYERAKDAAQTSNRAKSSFLANMSHEIRTPLSGVIGMMKLLGATDLDATQRHYTGLAAASAKQLLNLIDDILDFSKIEAGKLEFAELEFSPKVVVEDCINGLSYIAKEKGISLAGHVDTGVPEFLVGDPHRFRQVLVNLVGNALKFTCKGEVRVFMQATPVRPGEFDLEIEVSDTGIGIATEKKDRLFKSFSQVDDSTARVYGGTGLGLAISKELVERMGGRITCRSEEGRGSIFSFAIRLAVPDTGRADEAASTEKPGESPSPTLQKLRILVAEDEPVNREVVVSYLQGMGWETTAVANGKSAVETFNSGHFDLVLMDVQMPWVDGFEATRLIREQESKGTPRVPIIGLTAHALKGDRDKCLSAGMDDYLTKPVEPEILYATIRRWAAIPQVAQRPEPGPAQTVCSGVLQKIGPDRRDELIRSFLLGLSEGRGKLREGINKGDFDEVSFWAHRIRGSLMALGFDAAAAVAREIELLSTKSVLEDTDELLEKLDAKIEEVKELISSCHAG
jgi:CheY-like chemotaxis protein/HPt (histidine-containing phosphotransfer) domain-containing protein